MRIEEIRETIENATPDQMEQLSNFFVKLKIKKNVNKFTEKIILTENNKKEVFEKFIYSDSVNGLIYAPTQVGKY